MKNKRTELSGRGSIRTAGPSESRTGERIWPLPSGLVPTDEKCGRFHPKKHRFAERRDGVFFLTKRALRAIIKTVSENSERGKISPDHVGISLDFSSFFMDFQRHTEFSPKRTICQIEVRVWTAAAIEVAAWYPYGCAEQYRLRQTAPNRSLSLFPDGFVTDEAVR